MELSDFLKSIIDQDICAVVVCNLEHKIIYMNPAAVRRYAKSGGAELLGKSLMQCHHARSAGQIEKVVQWFGEDRKNNRVYTSYNEKENKDVYMIALRDADGALIGYYEKHEYRNRETREKYRFCADVY